jgi:hypothetical protein
MCMNIEWECISCASNLKEIKCLTAILLAVQWTKLYSNVYKLIQKWYTLYFHCNKQIQSLHIFGLKQKNEKNWCNVFEKDSIIKIKGLYFKR